MAISFAVFRQGAEFDRAQLGRAVTSRSDMLLAERLNKLFDAARVVSQGDDACSTGQSRPIAALV